MRKDARHQMVDGVEPTRGTGGRAAESAHDPSRRQAEGGGLRKRAGISRTWVLLSPRGRADVGIESISNAPCPRRVKVKPRIGPPGTPVIGSLRVPAGVVEKYWSD
jgi:hypothetical protein